MVTADYNPAAAAAGLPGGGGGGADGAGCDT